MSEALSVLTFEEFLAAEQASEIRHEYVLGQTWAMAGATERHDLLAYLIGATLGPGALAAGCRPFAGNRIVLTRSGAGYYPDFMIACGSAPHLHHETDPALVVEVLSYSTYRTDRREKSLAYTASPSLELYLLVSQSERRIDVARRSDDHPFVRWEVASDGGLLFTRFGTLSVDELYDQLDRIATTPA